MEETNNPTAQPETQAAQGTGQDTQTQAPNPATQEDLSWLDKSTFGDNAAEAVVKQAKSYPAAVKKMHQATQEAAELRRQKEELEAIVLTQQQQPQHQPQYQQPYQQPFNAGISPEIKQQLEQRYGTTFDQLQGFYDTSAIAAQNAITPVSRKLESMMNVMAGNEVMRNIENMSITEPALRIPEVRTAYITELNKFNPEERMRGDVMRNCLNNVKGQKQNVIVDMLVKEQMEQLKGKPVESTPAFTTTNSMPGTTQVSVQKVVEVDERVKANLLRSGMSEEDINRIYSVEKRGNN